jgi:uncharacterized protein (TIGR02302 family)
MWVTPATRYRIAAIVLGFCFDSLESLLIGATPDPSEPARDPDAVSRLQLGQALQRAKYAIAWERSWPHLARLLSIVGLFLVVSWAGLWLALPFVARAVGLGLFVFLALGGLFPLLRFRWPSREEGLSRLDRGTGIRHRPATALTDTLATQDPVALALWQAQRERTLASIKRIRAGLPSPRLPAHDPWALRALVAVLMVAAYVAAGDERGLRTGAAFDWNGVLSPANVRVDAWVTPPLYTSKPPIILSAANKEAAIPAAGPLPVPAGSTLIVRSSGGTLDVVAGGGVTEAVPAEQAPKGTNERHFTISGDGTAHVRAPSGQPLWKFSATPDRAPTIALAKDPERQARGSLQMSYKIEDDYGVTEAQAHFAVRPNDAPKSDAPKSGAAARPLFEAPQFALVLPNARTRNGVGQTVKDLSEDPYAGADVTLTLTAKDEAGNEGMSEPFNMRLPERLFTKPLARALIEQRRLLALDANQNSQVYAALDALMIAPELFTPEAGQYLGLYSVARQLEAARTDDAMRAVVARLWALAVTIEDGNITDVDKALRAAQEALKQALERGASDEEIKKLTENLRAALDNFMRQLAEQLRNNPQQLARPLDPNTRMLRQQDLNNMIERMERLSRSGDKDAAKQLLEQLQQMLENLQMAQPGQSGDADMEQALNELGDMIRKQQQLRDKTFKQGQDSRRDRQRGKPSEGMGDLQQDQQGLRDRLKKLQQELAKRGMGPGQRGEKGQQGQDGDPQAGDGEDGLGEADNAMGDAGGRLGEGNADGAVESQGKALEALRKGAQSLAEAMQQGDGDGQGDGPGNRAGRQQSGGNQSDPLGRPLHGREFGDDLTVKIPGEIDVQRVRRILEELRRRLADPQRPQLELDYIERLLKDY